MSEPKSPNITHITEAASYPDRVEAKKRMYRRRRFGAALVTAAGLSGVALVGNQVVDSVNAPSFEEKVEATVEKDPTILNAVVVLKQGVNLRSSPSISNGDGAGETGNVLKTLKSDEVVVLDHPLVYVNHVNQEFLGTVDKEGNYVWVNAAAAQADEAVSGKDYVEYIVDANGARRTSPANFEAGAFYQDASQEQRVAGMALMSDFGPSTGLPQFDY